MRQVLRTLALAATALVLLATSRHGEPLDCEASPLVPGPVPLAVDTTCGPTGAVTATVDPTTCELTLEGAAAVGLPSAGRVDGTDLWLQEGDAPRHCDGGERAQGEWAVRCYDLHESGGLGCGGSDLPACDAVLRISPP